MTDLQDPFAQTRTSGGYIGDFDGEIIPVLVNYADVRQAANDWKALSNKAPGRIQIPAEDDVRNLTQLPIETDPPQHTDYKALVQDFFRRPRTDPEVKAGIEGVVAAVLDDLPDGYDVDVLGRVALPIQSRALAVLLGLPEADAEDWIGWGLHAFKTTSGNDQAAADRLLRMIEGHVDRAMKDGGQDFFAYLAQSQINGRPLTRDEIVGFAHVTFAGGRDTLINCIGASFAHFARFPKDLDRLRDNPRAVPIAVEEIIRYTSPLSHIGRICSGAAKYAGIARQKGERVALCWAAANLDPARFADAGALRIDRQPNPHVAFGSGPHSCLGATHAREVLRALIMRMTATILRLELVRIKESSRSIGGPRLRHGFADLRVTLHRK